MNHRLSIIGRSGTALSVTAVGEGIPIMFLHGFPLDHRMWEPQLDELGQEFQVIAPDFRGFGDSTFDDTAYSLRELADDVEMVRSRMAANQKIILCGLSMGGYVAFEYWQRYSEHLAGLILSNTKPDADTAEVITARKEMAEKAQREGTWAAASGMLEKLVGGGASHAAVRDQVTEIIQSQARDAVAAAQLAMASRIDFTSQLSKIDIPTMVITGEYDPIAPPAATQAWASEIKKARIETLPGATHMPPLECPNKFNQVIRDFAKAV